MNLNNIISFRKTLSVSISIISIALISLILFTFIALAQIANPTGVKINDQTHDGTTPTFATREITVTILGVATDALGTIEIFDKNNPSSSNNVIGGTQTTARSSNTGTATERSRTFTLGKDGNFWYRVSQQGNGASSGFIPDGLGKFRIDTTPPEITLGYTVAEVSNVKTATVNVRGLSTGDSWKWRRQKADSTYTDYTTGSGTSSSASFTTIHEGLHEVLASDRLGNSATYTVNVTLDTTPPAAPTSNISFGGTPMTSGSTTYLNAADTISVALTFHEGDIQGLSSIQFKNGSSPLGDPVEATSEERTVSGTERTVHTATYTIPAGVNVADGELSFSLVNFADITDAAGNSLAEEFSGDISDTVIDTTSPTIPDNTKSRTFGPDPDSARTVAGNTTTFLNAGDEISVVFELDENVNGDIKVRFINGTTNNLGGSEPITATKGSGNMYTATYRFGEGGRDLNTVYTSLNYIITNEEDITDAAGNSLVEQSQTSLSNITYDSAVPLAPVDFKLAQGQDSGDSNSDGVTNMNKIRLITNEDSNNAYERSVFRVVDENSVVFEAKTPYGNRSHVFVNEGNNGSNGFTEGTYTATARQEDRAGNLSEASEPITIVIDTTDPTSIPSNRGIYTDADSGVKGDHITNAQNVMLVSDIEADVRAVWTINSSEQKVAFSNSGTQTVTFSSLGEGEHTATAKHIDLAGNFGPVSPSYTFTVDRTRPSVSVPTFTTTGDIVVGDPAVKYLNFEDDDGGDTVTATYTFTELVFGDLPVVQVKNGTANLRGAVVVKDTTDAKIYTAKYTVVDGDNVDSGNFGFDITNEGSITDVAGNVFAVRGTDTSTIVIDTKDPKTLTIDITAATDTCVDFDDDNVCEFTSLNQNTDNITSNTTPNFIFGSNLEPNAIVTIYGTGEDRTYTTSSTNHQTDTYTAAPALGEGLHRAVFATQTDRAGNVSENSPNIQIIIDTTAPSIDDVTHNLHTDTDSGAKNDLLTNFDTFRVLVDLGFTNSGNNADRFFARINPKIAGDFETIAPSSAIGLQLAQSGQGEFSLNVEDTVEKELEFSIDFYDIAGNKATVTQRKVRLDRTTPEATFILNTASDSGVEGDRVTNITTPTLTFENLEFSDDPTEGTGKAKLEVFVLSASDNGDTTFDTNELTPIHTSDNVTGTSLSCTFDADDVDNTNGPIACSGTNPFTTDGVYKIYTKQTDDAGNITSTTRDNTAADKLDYNPGTGVKGDNVIIIDTTPPQAPSAPDLDPANDSFGGNPNRSRTGTDQDDNTNQTTHSYFVDASDRQASESVALDGYNLTKEQHHILIGVFTKTDEASGGDDQAYPVIGTPDENDVEDTTVAPASGADPADSEEDRNIDTMTRFADFDEVTKLKTKSRTGNLFTHNFDSVVPDGKDRYVYTVARQRDLAGNVSEYSDIMRVRVDRELPKGVSSQLNLHPARDTGVSNEDSQTAATNPVFRAKFHSDDTRINSLSTDIDYFEIRTVELDESNEFTTIGDFAYLSPTDSASQASHDYLEENTARDIEALEDPYTPGYKGGYLKGVTVVVDSLNIPKFNTWYGFKFYSVDLAGNVRPSPYQSNLRILVPPPTPQPVNLLDASDSCAEVVVGTPGCQAGNKTDNITSHTTLTFDGAGFGNGLTETNAEKIKAEQDSDAASGVTRVELEITPPASLSSVGSKVIRFIVKHTTETDDVTNVVTRETSPDSNYDVPSLANKHNAYTFKTVDANNNTLSPITVDLNELYPNPSAVDTPNYHDGDWVFKVQAVSSGERGGDSDTLTVTVDTTPPGNLFVENGLELTLVSAASETGTLGDNYATRHRISCPDISALLGNPTSLCGSEFPFAVRARHPSENDDYTSREIGGTARNRHVVFTEYGDLQFDRAAFYYPDGLTNHEGDRTTDTIGDRENLRFEVFDTAGNKAEEVNVYVPEIRVYQVTPTSFLYFDSLNDEGSAVRGVTYHAVNDSNRCLGPTLLETFSSTKDIDTTLIRTYQELTAYSTDTGIPGVLSTHVGDVKPTDAGFCLVNTYDSSETLPKVFRVAQHGVVGKGGNEASVVRQLVSNFVLRDDTGEVTDRNTSDNTPSLHAETIPGSTEVEFEYKADGVTEWTVLPTDFNSERGLLETESLSPALVDGTYNVRAQLRLPGSDPTNDRTIYTLGNIVIDTVAPTLSQTSITPASVSNGRVYLNSGSSLALTFTLSEVLEGQFSVELLNEGNSLTTPLTVTTTGDETLQTRTATFSIPSQDVTQGSLGFRITNFDGISDTAGNVVDPDFNEDNTILDLYSIDTTDPKITFLETSGSGGHTYILLISDASEIVKIKKSGEEGPSGNPCRNDIHEDDDHTIGDVISVRDSNRVCVSVEDAAGNIANSITEGNRRTSKTIRGIGNLVIENTLVESGTIYTKPGTFNITGITAGGAKVLFKIADSAPTGNDLQVLATADYSFDTETGKTTFPDGTSLQIEKSSDNGKKLYGWIWLDASDGSTAIPAIDFGTLAVDGDRPDLIITDTRSNAAAGSASSSSNEVTATFTTNELIRNEIGVDFLGVPETDITCTVGTFKQVSGDNIGRFIHSCTIPLTNAEESTGANAQISITVLDKAGNSASVREDTGLIVNATAPQIRVSFGGYDKVKAGDDISFRVEVVDGQLVSPFVPIEGTLSAGGTISVTQATGDYTYSIPTSAAQGPLTIDFPSISDSAGNSVDPEPITIAYIDTKAPTITSASVEGERRSARLSVGVNHGNNSTVPGRETITASFGGDCSEFENDETRDTSDGTSTEAKDYVFTFEAGRGDYSDCTVTVTDGAGNQSTPFTISDSFEVSSGGGGRVGGGGGGSARSFTPITFTVTPAAGREETVEDVITTPTVVPTRILVTGSAGGDVKQVQEKLNQTNCSVAEGSNPGAPGRETTYYGPATERAVACFQRENGIVETGVVDTETRNELFKDDESNKAVIDNLKRILAGLIERLQALQQAQTENSETPEDETEEDEEEENTETPAKRKVEFFPARSPEQDLPFNPFAR